MNQEVFAALAEALEQGRRGGARHDRRPPPVPRRSASAPRCSSTPTAARSAPSAAAAMRTKRSGRRARRSRIAGRVERQVRAQRRFRAGDGLVCGGQMEVFIEPVEAAPEVYRVRRGARRATSSQEWPTTSGSRCTSWTTARSSPTPSASAKASTSSSTRFRRGSAAQQLPATSYAVIVTRGHRHDLDTLRALAAPKPPLCRPDRQPRQGEAHLRRAPRRRDSPEALRRVHAPIGLDIGAITPQEIAVSILAELIAVKHGKVSEPGAAAAACGGRARCKTLMPSALIRHATTSSVLIRNATILT